LLTETSFKNSVSQLGFAILPNIIGPSEAEAVLVELDAGALHRSRAGARHILRQPVVERVATDERILNLAREVLGRNAVPFRAPLFDKSPNSNWLIAHASSKSQSPLARRVLHIEYSAIAEFENGLRLATA